jgi:hypothetical protein
MTTAHPPVDPTRLALLDSVPVIERNGRSFAVRLDDIPQPYQNEFRKTLRGSAIPSQDNGQELAFVWDWVRFINRTPWSF